MNDLTDLRDDLVALLESPQHAPMNTHVPDEDAITIKLADPDDWSDDWCCVCAALASPVRP